MMGLEPTTFCMASASIRSRPFASVRSNASIASPPDNRTNATEPERTPNLAILATERGAETVPAKTTARDDGGRSAGARRKGGGCREQSRSHVPPRVLDWVLRPLVSERIWLITGAARNRAERGGASVAANDSIRSPASA
jgi:hypothetical protein